MVIAGPCLFNPGDEEAIQRTHDNLVGVADIFRVKLWGGGTRLDRYYPGVGASGLTLLKGFDLPVTTEIHTPEQFDACKGFGVWIGARNSSNYSLIEHCCLNSKTLYLKRNPGSTIQECIDLLNLIYHRYNVKAYLIERGINTLDRGHGGRWTPDLKIAYILKHDYPELFESFIIDCSHSAGLKRYVPDVYEAFKSIGVKHFMFECFDGESKTDKDHMLTTKELKEIL